MGVYRPDRPDNDTILRLFAELGSHAEAARRLNVPRTTFREWMTQAQAGIGPEPPPGKPMPEPAVDVQGDLSSNETVTITATGMITTVEELVARCKVDLTRWYVDKTYLNAWPSARSDGNALQMIQVKVSLERIPEWFMRPVQSVEALPRLPAPERTRPFRRAFILPDNQIGFTWSSRRTHLIPMHDRRAQDLAVQLIAELKPDVILDCGDLLDLAEMSTKFSRAPKHNDTTQPAMMEAHWHIQRRRRAAPHAEIIILEGNHDLRLRALIEKMAAQFAEVSGVTDHRPIYDLRRLLGLDALDVQFIGPYGAVYWLFDKIACSHGEHHGASGMAVAKALARSEHHHSQISGHDHKAAIAWRTVFGPGVRREVFAMNPGTMALCGDEVPPHSPRNNWQQSFGVVDVYDDGFEDPRIIKVHDGICHWQGRRFVGRENAEEIEAATGWPMTPRTIAATIGGAVALGEDKEVSNG